MEKIKYKAFDEKENKWYRVAALMFDEEGDYFGGDLFDDNDEKIDFEKHDIKLVMFTGLTDKNGKEVYEGDIVKRTINEGLPSQQITNWIILWGSWCYVRSIEIEKLNFFPFDAIDARSNCEIIGNIYQAPN